MSEKRTVPVPDTYVHVELPPVRVRGFDRLFARLSEAFASQAAEEESIDGMLLDELEREETPTIRTYWSETLGRHVTIPED